MQSQARLLEAKARARRARTDANQARESKMPASREQLRERELREKELAKEKELAQVEVLRSCTSWLVEILRQWHLLHQLQDLLTISGFQSNIPQELPTCHFSKFQRSNTKASHGRSAPGPGCDPQTILCVACRHPLPTARGLFNNDPRARPQTEFLCKPIQGVMEQESLTRNHLREASGKRLGSIREASGRHLGSI